MKPIVLALLIIGMAFAGEKNYKVDYVGGSLNLKSGSGMKLFINPDAVQLVKGDYVAASIPTAGLDVQFAIEAKPLSAGRAAGRLGVAFVTLGASTAIAAATQSYITKRLEFAWMENGKRSNALIEVHGDINQLIANLEAATGKQIIH